MSWNEGETRDYPERALHPDNRDMASQPSDTTARPSIRAHTARVRQPVDSHAAVHLVGLRKSYGSTLAVDQIDLDIEPGEIVALLGPNGAGKSTTVDLLLGLARPDAGQARLFGLRPSQACAAGHVGAMLQSGGLPPEISVGELIDLMRSLYPRACGCHEVLARGGVSELADRRTTALSGGEAQRVRFALALVPDPELLVLDEPTAAMDVESRQAFWSAMRAWAGGGRTVLFATHYLEEADSFADRAVLLRHGRVVADAPPAEIRAMAGGRTIRARLDTGPTPTVEELAAVAGVTHAERGGPHRRPAVRRQRRRAAGRTPALARPARHRGERPGPGRGLRGPHERRPTGRPTGLPGQQIPDRQVRDPRGDRPMIATYTRSEIRRSFRNPQYVVFAFGFPLVLFLVFQSTYGAGELAKVPVTAYIMVSMATFGAMSAVFSTGGRIALERELGWNRQLRLTALSGRAYVASKSLAGFAMAVPAMAAVFAAAGTLDHVHLTPGRWALASVSILVALIPISALGVWVGYAGRGDSLQAVSGGVYSMLALFGGLWIPITLFPHWLQIVCQALPVYWVAQSGEPWWRARGSVGRGWPCWRAGPWCWARWPVAATAEARPGRDPRASLRWPAGGRR